MPSTVIRSTEALNAEADAVGALLNGGSLQLYAGTQPATPNAPVADQVLICALRFGSPAFTPAVNGIATATALIACPAAFATGIPTWLRGVTADGVPIFDGSVGLASESPDLILEPALVQVNARVTIGPVIYRASAA